MSFQLLKEDIIDQQLCQGCGLCAGICKEIEMIDLRPQLTGSCILEKKGNSCGKCYESCPQVNQKSVVIPQLMEHYSLKSPDGENFVATLSDYLIESKIVSQIIKGEQGEHSITPKIVTQSEDAKKLGDIDHGRSQILGSLMGVLEEFNQDNHETVGIFGMPCEISGAATISKNMNMDVLKIGSFCESNYPTTELKDGIICSPCSSSCPAGVDASGYIRLIKQGHYQEAIDLIREKNPLPSICGRICTHECENDCTLLGVAKPMAIRELKKYVTEWEIKRGLDKPIKSPNPEGKKVAIVGSGPAGLSAAYYLAKLGYRPTILEKTDKVGGMLRLGIPQFRLPDNVIDHDVEFIKRAGVEIITNKTVNADLTFDNLKSEGYEAIFLAIGQYEPYSLGIPGEDLKNIHTALDFVQKWKYKIEEGSQEFKDKVVGIVGGGSVALDAAQTALRLGAKKVMVIYRRSENELPARREDYEHSKREGIEFHFLRNPTTFIPDENDAVRGTEVVKMELCEADASGRRRPEPQSCSEYEIDKDHVVVAIGQGVDCSDLAFACDNKLVHKKGKLEVDEVTLQTAIPWVFAGGDMVYRSKNVVISSVAHGREAANSIDRYLQGKDLKADRPMQERMYSDGKYFTPIDVPEPAPLNSIENLHMNVQEIESVFSEEFAKMEATRCLGCNNYCLHCQDFVGVKGDITIGQIGSQPGFTTVYTWTDRGKQIIEDLIVKRNLEKAEVAIQEIDDHIAEKLKRELVDHPKTTREMILFNILRKGSTTISEMKTQLNLPIKDIRYHALRLAQEHKVTMVLGEEEPIFSPYVEE
jgi:NADPH-dependent glutamate synthase beta subunit-like oxidoreductase/coenzyme F420-reducing hydrogenase beta subunit